MVNDLSLRNRFGSAVSGCLPCVRHTLHRDLRGAWDHAGVPGRDDDSGGNGVCWASNVYTDRKAYQHTHVPTTTHKHGGLVTWSFTRTRHSRDLWMLVSHKFDFHLFHWVLIDVTYCNWPADGPNMKRQCTECRYQDVCCKTRIKAGQSRS